MKNATAVEEIIAAMRRFGKATMRHTGVMFVLIRMMQGMVRIVETYVTAAARTTKTTVVGDETTTEAVDRTDAGTMADSLVLEGK